MSKTKTPFFALGAHGSVGRSITAQGLPKDTLIRTKPLPAYRYTLPQAYQRWLYEDYAYLWRQQSLATRRQYASDGVRFHLTGFQYWMKYNLTHLPDIAGWWKLDDNTGATTVDNSRNMNTGTIIGASPDTGLIDRCLLFDGINDLVSVPNAPSLQITGDLTIEALGRIDAWEIINYIIWKNHIWEFDFAIENWAGNQYLEFHHGDGVSELMITLPLSISTLTWYHFAATRSAVPKTVTFYLNGTPVGTLPYLKTPVAFTDPVQIGMRGSNTLWNGPLDNVILYNRPLDATEILRHSLRRYPA